jgi:predicted component of type VI protein secretion system
MKVKLVVLRGQPQGKCMLFPHGEYLIGRGRECHLRPNSSWVSRQHCMLQVRDGKALLRDLGSTNGTLVNGARVMNQHDLANGDRIQIGPLVFEIHLEHPVDPATKPTPSDTLGSLPETDGDLPTLEKFRREMPLENPAEVDASDQTQPH